MLIDPGVVAIWFWALYYRIVRSRVLATWETETEAGEKSRRKMLSRVTRCGRCCCSSMRSPHPSHVSVRTETLSSPPKVRYNFKTQPAIQVYRHSSPCLFNWRPADRPGHSERTGAPGAPPRARSAKERQGVMEGKVPKMSFLQVPHGNQFCWTRGHSICWVNGLYTPTRLPTPINRQK